MIRHPRLNIPSNVWSTTKNTVFSDLPIWSISFLILLPSNSNQNFTIHVWFVCTHGCSFYMSYYLHLVWGGFPSSRILASYFQCHHFPLLKIKEVIRDIADNHVSTFVIFQMFWYLKRRIKYSRRSMLAFPLFWVVTSADYYS